MAKSPDAFRTISEVAAQLDTPAHVLRFWESKFPQIKPVKRAGGRRYYRPDDIALVAGIKVLLHEQGMTIRGVQKLLKERGTRHVATLSALPWEGLESPDEPQEEPAAEAPEAVVVGPWPGAGEPEVDGTALTAVAEAPSEGPAPQSAASAVGEFVAGVASRLATREARADARPSVARLREALLAADRQRIQAEATRLRPLVQRLRDLQGSGSGRPA